jgi:hypothetical protein
MNGGGLGYCQPFPGDDPSVKYITSVKAYLERVQKTSCNNGRRFEYDCVRLVSTDEELRDYITNELYYSYFPRLVNNDACVAVVYNRFYWGSAAALIALAWMWCLVM